MRLHIDRRFSSIWKWQREHAWQLLAAGGVAALWLGLHIAGLERYPVVSCDEPFYTESALRYFQAVSAGLAWPTSSGRIFYLPHGRTYWLILGLASTLFGPKLGVVRAVSLIGLLLLILSTYLLGKQIAGTQRSALWSAVLMGFSWLAFYSGHLARPDILAAAGGAFVLALWVRVIRTLDHKLSFWLGLLSVLQIDLHFVLVHLAWPAVLLAALVFGRSRRWSVLALFSLGLLLGAAILIWLHLGSYAAELGQLLLSNPGATLRSYTGAGADEQSFSLAQIEQILTSFVAFWQRYYVWPAAIALPQAALFVLGATSVFGWVRGEVQRLAVIVLLSSVSFMLINTRSGYVLLGYALIWLPMYLILGTHALFELRGGEHPILRRLPAGMPYALLAGLLVLYMVGDVALMWRRAPGEYDRAADALADQLEPGSRVMSSRIWWFGLSNHLIFIDEQLLASPDSFMWWNTVPSPQEEENIGELQLVWTGAGSASASDYITAGMPELHPDYVILDPVLGCATNDEVWGPMLRKYVQNSCQFVEEVDTHITPEAPYYGVQSIYACEWDP